MSLATSVRGDTHASGSRPGRPRGPLLVLHALPLSILRRLRVSGAWPPRAGRGSTTAARAGLVGVASPSVMRPKQGPDPPAVGRHPWQDTTRRRAVWPTPPYGRTQRFLHWHHRRPPPAVMMGAVQPSGRAAPLPLMGREDAGHTRHGPPDGRLPHASEDTATSRYVPYRRWRPWYVRIARRKSRFRKAGQ
jgi:hypothetical protein